MENQNAKAAPTIEQLMALVEQQRAQIEALVSKTTNKDTDRFGIGEGLNCKVSEKGAVSVYGVHSRFPITLYKSQWLRLIKSTDALLSFIEANDAKLAVKPVKAVETK